MQYKPVFWPLLAPLRYTDHCVKVLRRFDQKWSCYRPSKLCLICRCIRCMRYTPVFCPVLASLRYTDHCVKVRVMKFWPKIAELQAFKVVPDLPVHAVCTNFLVHSWHPWVIPTTALCQSFMVFWPKMAELQASKVVPDLLVYTIYTNLFAHYWYSKIWCFLEILAICEILAIFLI